MSTGFYLGPHHSYHHLAKSCQHPALRCCFEQVQEFLNERTNSMAGECLMREEEIIVYSSKSSKIKTVNAFVARIRSSVCSKDFKTPWS